MQRLFIGLGTFSVRYRWLVVVVWVLITIVSVKAFPGLSSISQSGISGFLPASAPSVSASRLAAPFQNAKYASATLIVARPNGVLTGQDQAAIDRVEDAIRADAHVKSVTDVGVSHDGVARQALIQADVPSGGGGDAPALVNSIRAQLSSVGASSGLDFHLTGALAQTVDASANNASTRSTLTKFSILFIIVMLLVVFRSPLAPLITLIPAALAYVLSGVIITGLATHLNFNVSVVGSALLVVLVLGAGTDYALFLIYRMREELRRGLSPHDAVIRAVSTVGETIAFSALTVVAALLSLLTAQFGLYQGLGPTLSTGILVMLLAGLTLLPALLAIFGRAVFWPLSTAPSETQRSGVWGRLTINLLKRPLVTLAAGILLFAVLAIGRVNTPTTGISLLAAGPSGADSTLGTSLVNQHYPALSDNPTEALFHYAQPVWGTPAVIDSLQQQLTSVPAIQTVRGPLNPNGIPLTVTQLAQLHQTLGAPQLLSPEEPASLQVQIPLALYNAYRGTAQYISADGRTVAFIAILKDSSSSAAAVNAVPALRSSIDRIGQITDAEQAGVVGVNELNYDQNSIALSDLSHIIPLVAILIALLLAIVLRSLIAPLYLVASIVFSYLAAIGASALLFVRLGGQDGINYILPFLLFVFLMALGSDYNLLVMTRIREEAHVKPLRMAVGDAVGVTGTTVTTAGLILAGTFTVLGVVGGSSQIQQIGLGVTIGILMDTFLVRTLIVPSVVVLLGRWNWWPSALFHQPEPAVPNNSTVAEMAGSSPNTRT